MYCNSESRSRGYDQQPHGIGFGGSIDKPRLFISETLDGCMASSGDLTFEPGALLPPPGVEGEPPRKYFELEACEVWGAGGDEVVEEALGSRLKEREIVASNISKARKVDKAQFLDDFKSGLIESKAFQVRHFMYRIELYSACLLACGVVCICTAVFIVRCCTILRSFFILV